MSWSGQAPIVISRDLVDRAIIWLNVGGFLFHCAVIKDAVLWTVNIVRLYLLCLWKKLTKLGPFTVILFFVYIRGDVCFFLTLKIFTSSLILCFSSCWLYCLYFWRSFVLEGQYCGKGCIFGRNCYGLMASIPFDSCLKHGIGSLLLARASGWAENTEGINKVHNTK